MPETFVGRKKELLRLTRALDQALAGQGQVIFVTGEAGSGKTALVTEFARRAQTVHEGLLVVLGQSDAQTGMGDPYLPFREMLGQLTGDVEAMAQRGVSQENAGRLRGFLRFSGQALVELGPDLIDILVPGVGLITRAGTFLADKAGWLDRLEARQGRLAKSEPLAGEGITQDNIFEQTTKVLIAMAEKQPLLLVLDDLQWADLASIGLLFRLGRRIGASRILLLGTYRPDEIALGRQGERHPLEKVLAELTRYQGDILVDLNETNPMEGRHFVDALLDSEPNRLGEDFRQALFKHTGGHPLFTVELLRDMQEGDVLVQDAGGRWAEGSALDWAELPARIEGVIQERIGRLEEALSEALTVASVEGELFTAEVVARVQGAEARDLVRRLSRELEKKHRLVSAEELRRLRSGQQRLSLYRFRHNLLQKYLYHELDPAERSYLHEDVGTALETLYDQEAAGVAVQLARHFVEAGLSDKALRYLRLAADQATARYAHREAADYYGRALALAPTQEPETRFELLFSRVEALHRLGDRDAQREDLAKLEAMVEVLHDPRRGALLALERSYLGEDTGDYPSAVEAVQRAALLTQEAGDAQLETSAFIQWGSVLRHQGDFAEALLKLTRALTLAREHDFRRLEANSLANQGTVYAEQGDHVRAAGAFEAGLAIHQELKNRPGAAAALGNLGRLAVVQERWDQAREYLQQALQLDREVGLRVSEGNTLNSLAEAAYYQGDYAATQAYLEQALVIFRESEARSNLGLILNNLGELTFKQGAYARSRDYYQQALATAREIGSRAGEALVLGNLGRLLVHLGEPEVARDLSQQGVDLAREAGMRGQEANALGALGAALMALSDPDGARDCYERALTLRLDMGQRNRALEPLAGLVQVHLAQGESEKAQAAGERILAHLQEVGELLKALEGTDEPLWVLWVTCQWLESLDQPQALDLLATAHRLLQEQAGRITDLVLRRAYLWGMPVHRAILEAWQERDLARH